jgi:hypothetical protein
MDCFFNQNKVSGRVSRMAETEATLSYLAQVESLSQRKLDFFPR